MLLARRGERRDTAEMSTKINEVFSKNNAR